MSMLPLRIAIAAIVGITCAGGRAADGNPATAPLRLGESAVGMLPGPEDGDLPNQYEFHPDRSGAMRFDVVSYDNRVKIVLSRRTDSGDYVQVTPTNLDVQVPAELTTLIFACQRDSVYRITILPDAERYGGFYLLSVFDPASPEPDRSEWFDSLLTYFRDAEATARARRDFFRVAQAMSWLAWLQWDPIDPERAESLLKQAAELLRSTNGKSLAFAMWLEGVGLTLANRNSYAGARPYLEEALAIAEKSRNLSDPWMANLATAVGVTSLVLGDAERGNNWYDRVMRIVAERIAAGDLPRDEAAYIRGMWALGFLQSGDLARADSLLRDALAAQETLPPGLRTSLLVKQAEYLQRVGLYDAVVPTLEQACGLIETRFGPASPETGSCLQPMASALEQAGQLDQARKTYERLLSIQATTRDRTNWLQRVGVMVRLGDLLVHTGQVDRARDLFDQALAIPEERAAAVYPSISSSLSEIRRILRGGTPPREVSDDFRDGLTVLTQRLYYILPDVPSYMITFADIFRRNGYLQEALLTFESAARLVEREFGGDHPLMARALEGVATVQWQKGREGPALEAASRAARLLDCSNRRMLTVLPESEALAMLSTQGHPDEILFSGLLYSETKDPAWLERCWDWTLRRRGIVFEELAKRKRRVLEIGDLEKKREKANRKYVQLAMQGPDGRGQDTYGQNLREAQRSLEDAERALAQATNYAAPPCGTSESDRRDILSLLPASTVLVEFVRTAVRKPGVETGDSHYVALVASAQAARLAFVDLGPAGLIESRVRNWRDALTANYSIPREEAARREFDAVRRVGAELREVVWDPVEALAGGATRFFLVPDGALHEIPFAALPATEGGFLLERGLRFHLLGTGRDLLSLRRARGGSNESRGALVVGDPEFGGQYVAQVTPSERSGDRPSARQTDDCDVLGRSHWRALPASAREASEIAALLRKREPVVRLLGKAATEQRFRQEAEGKRILHLATHGFFLSDSCAIRERTGDTPPRPDSAGATTAAPFGERIAISPLLLSGLVLANANTAASAKTAFDDGILTAQEIAALDLRSVELAVLSACETGSGAVEVGEGVLGLRRALELAGVRSVVMSQWMVPDESARLWMGWFYSARLAGSSLVDATADASLRMLQRLRETNRPEHPYHWAGFVSAGAWE